MENHQLINQTSGDVEYFTPPIIIEAARATLGCIDLDPASSEAANQIVKAKQFHTAITDGLAHKWYGHIWMNHPFHRKTNALWINKLFEEFHGQRVVAACCLTYAATSEKWFQPLMAWPQCFLYPRTNFLRPDGQVKRGVSKGSVVTYLGFRSEAFLENFQSLGAIKVPMKL